MRHRADSKHNSRSDNDDKIQTGAVEDEDALKPSSKDHPKHSHHHHSHSKHSHNSNHSSHHHSKHPSKLIRNQYPVPLFDSVCLVISSMFFLLPGLQAFHCGLQFYGVLSFLTSAISMNYWYYAMPGWRRTLDLIMAKVSFVIYFVTGALYVTDATLLVLGWPICVCILLCYWLSSSTWQRDSWVWVLFHMAFHFFVAVEQSVVLTGSFDQCSAMKLEIHRWERVFAKALLEGDNSNQ